MYCARFPPHGPSGHYYSPTTCPITTADRNRWFVPSDTRLRGNKRRRRPSFSFLLFYILILSIGERLRKNILCQTSVWHGETYLCTITIHIHIRWRACVCMYGHSIVGKHVAVGTWTKQMPPNLGVWVCVCVSKSVSVCFMCVIRPVRTVTCWYNYVVFFSFFHVIIKKYRSSIRNTRIT